MNRRKMSASSCGKPSILAITPHAGCAARSRRAASNVVVPVGRVEQLVAQLRG